MRAAHGGRFAGRSALVTGAGSGLGAALSRALAAAGAEVVCADIDLDAATAVAEPLGARAVRLDVTDAEAVAAVVADVAARHGGIDYLFNNAGITFGGETEQLTLEQWNAVIDVNLRGVVHGVHAAYPRMVERGRGHIVNTASMGGLMAAGMITSYVATKHAVVGLSLALRSEAAAKGVDVTVVCPAAIETPLLEKGQIGSFHGRDYYLKGQGIRRPLDPDELAGQVLATVAARRAMLVTPRASRIAWRIGRLSPRFVQWSAIRFVERQRGLQQTRTASGERRL